MQAFLNDEKIKQKYLDRVKAHALADEIIKGKYWENGKGCAVGCTIHSSEHIKYEDEIAPQWLARVEDTIFEGLPSDRAKKFPLEFLAAINPGADLDKIKTPFIIFVLKSSIESVRRAKFDKEKFPDTEKAVVNSIAAITEIIRCHEQNIDLSAAMSAAASAAAAAVSAAMIAPVSAAVAAAMIAEASAAAWNAANAVVSAGAAAVSATWNAPVSAAVAAAVSAAWNAAESMAESAASAEYKKFADKLLELIRGCK